MAKNPFSGLVNDDFKKLHRDAINHLLESSVGGRTCEISYGITSYVECDTCGGATQTQTSLQNNVFQHGGRVPFHAQTCATCNSTGKKPVEQTENVTMFPIWGAFDITKELVPIQADDVQSPQDLVLTIGDIGITPKLRRAKEIIINTDVEGLIRYRCEKVGEPKPAGFGDDWVVATWRRLG